MKVTSSRTGPKSRLWDFFNLCPKTSVCNGSKTGLYCVAIIAHILLRILAEAALWRDLFHFSCCEEYSMN